MKPTDDPVLAWVQASDAQEKGCTKDAVALLESSLEKLYMAEDIYLPHVSMTELLLADALDALGETSRAVACRMIGYQHAVIREARTPGANAPDLIRVPYGHEQ